MLHSGVQADDRPVRDILGIRVSDFTRADALEFVHGCVTAQTFTPVSFLNAHNANVAARNPEFRDALAEFTVLSDGIGVDLAARLLHGAAFRDNLNGTDLVPEILRSAPLPMKVALFGAQPGVAERAADCFRGMDNRHEYRVLHHGFPKPDEEIRILDDLAVWRPDILLVALGVPGQELWITRHVTARHCTIAMGVGALFDFAAGTVPRAPGWMRTLRLEWLHRLAWEPRRLWRRYLIGNPLFLARVSRQKLGGNGETASA